MTNQIESYEALLERVRVDENFKHRFITDPNAVLAEVGAKVPDSVRVEVHEDGQYLRNYILLKKEQLEGFNLEEEPIIGKVLQRALADDAFKNMLLKNPKAAIKEVTGEDVPDALNICFYEDTPTVKHLVIPANPVNEELSDSDLAMVAGGISLPSFGRLLKPPIVMGFRGAGKWFNQ